MLLKTEEIDKVIYGDNIIIDLLLSDKDETLLIQLMDIDIDYIKTLSAYPPVFLTLQYFINDIRVKRNFNEYYCKHTQLNFDKLYYTIKIKETNELIGGLEIYDSDLNDCAELGIYITKKYAGFGYGTEAVKMAINIIKNTYTTKIVYKCDSDNIGSIKVANKCGFIFFESIKIYNNRYANYYILDI